MEKRGLRFFILHALAGQLQHWADQLRGEENLVQRDQANLQGVNQGRVTGVSRGPSAVETVAATDIESADADGPPPHWLARIEASRAGGVGALPTYKLPYLQKETANLLKKEEPANAKVVAHAHVLPVVQVNESAHVAEAGQRAPMAETREAITLAETGKQADEESGAHRDEMVISALPYSMAKQGEMERIGKSIEPVQAHEPDAKPVSSPEKWFSPGVLPNAFLQEEKSETHAVQQTRHNLWPQLSTAALTHGKQWQGKPNEQVETEMRWPSLPTEMTTNSQDWEMIQRLWERQQRLDDEQRGSSWNM